MYCKECKNEFERKTDNQIYCSKECRKVSWASKYVSTDPGWKERERVCEYCEQKYLPGAMNQKYCSPECGKQSLSFENVHKFIDKTRAGTYRWLKLRIKVLDRDNFTCKYCGRSPMAEDGVVLHIDHKIPKKKKGVDNIDNLITACSECNLGKSDLLLQYWRDEKKSNKDDAQQG